MAVTAELLLSFDPEYIEQIELEKKWRDEYSLRCYNDSKDFIRAVKKWYSYEK